MYPYWGKGVMSIVYALISTVFSLFSLTMAIPFLSVLFEMQPKITELVKWEFSTKAIANNFNYFLSTIIENKGPEAALLSVSIIVVVFVLLKTLFHYLSNYMYYL